MLFPSTHHSLFAHLRSAELPVRQQALDRFAEVYWKPAYKYIRLRWRRQPADAEDLTQAFFTGLLSRDVVGRFDPSRGSFHNYLRTCIDNFARNDAARPTVPLAPHRDFAGAEAELAEGATLSPEEIFYREWQRQIFTLAVGDLRALAAEQGKPVHFAVFEQYDLCEEEPRPTYEELAARHGLPVTQITNYMAWARRQLRVLASARLAGVIGSDRELVTETRRLFEGD